jgi:agmatinase
MDQTKLAALRARYANGRSDEAEDPDFRKAISLVFKPDGRRAFPYAGVSTLLDAPYRPDAPDLPDYGNLQVALVGVPMDLAVTNRSGSRLGPRAVRAIERIGPYHHTHRLAPLAEMRVADVGDVPFRSRYSLPDSIADIETFYTTLHAAGVIPVSIGGDHSISYPILRALGCNRPVGMVHIDAHCDTSGELEGSRFHHGGPFRQAVLDGVLDPARTIQIGIRGSAEMLYEFSYVSGMTVIHAEEIDTMGLPAVIAKARSVIGDGPFYLSFDVDAIDPAYTPGTGTPEVGGLTPREAQHILRGLAGLDLIGGDVVEVAPQYDATTVTAQIGAMMAFEIIALLGLKLRT